MPVFRSGRGLAPPWCELEYFDILGLSPGDRRLFERVGEREKLIVAAGRCRLRVAGQTVEAEEGANLDLLPGEDPFEVIEATALAVLVRMAGRWGEATGGSGVFAVERRDDASDAGDPVDWPKHTVFDNHYHDCDEYWILFEGRGVAVSEGRSYEVGPGDCIATGMGHHHDFPMVYEPVKAVYFETTMEGEKRPGHLWEHTHGPARPKPERV